ncbi:hypothetical protein C2E23DRAFT_838267 [Lenzites betulinus]|nr:hypothetical protein C2E23DRAFT_838267 [Lenzites betulinus]
MSFQSQVGGLAHPQTDPGRPTPSSSGGVPPPLPPRPGAVKVSPPSDDSSTSSSEDEGTVLRGPPVYGSREAASPETVLIPATEEELSEVQLRELYDDEEIERFLHLFSAYVREVRAPGAAASTPNLAQTPSASTPALSDTLSASSSTPAAPQAKTSARNSLAERIALDYFVPLLPPARPPPPEFSLGRLKHTTQRLYVVLEPLFSLSILPLLKLATWQNTRKSFVYCALYWVLWYHGMLLSALLMSVLYSLTRRKLHPYPSLDELRAHRSRIERSHTFGAMLSARLTASPALGVQDMWHLFKDYKETRRLKKAAKADGKKPEQLDVQQDDDAASVHSVASEHIVDEHEAEVKHERDDEDMKRLGLFLLGEVADLLERVKNIFLWRNPSASVFYGAVLFGWLILCLLPAQYLSRAVGFAVGGFFWHIIPILAVIPKSERSRIPPLLSQVPTDAEYAMDLISQRVARGLPVRPKRRKRHHESSEAGVAQTATAADDEPEQRSTSVDWNKWGDRLASTKERSGEIKNILKDGQWKQAESWKTALTPLVVTPQNGSETRIETHTFPAQLKQHPGLITLTPTTLFFTPLLSSRAALSIPLADVVRVKRAALMKGIDIAYTLDAQQKEAKFLFVASRDDLFARLVSWGGKRWTNV